MPAEMLNRRPRTSVPAITRATSPIRT
jgi:hypothetical protein